MEFHTARFGGSLVSQVNKFSRGYVSLMDIFIFNIVPLISSYIFIFAILGPQLPLFTLGLAALSAIFMLIAIFSFRSIRQLNIKETESQNVLSGQLADSVTNIMAIKSHSSEEAEKNRYDELNRRSREASLNVMNAIVKRDIGFGSVIVVISSLAFITLVGGQAWFGVPVGTLVLGVTYSSQILGQLWNFNGILRNTNRAFGDAQEMTKTLGAAKAVADAPGASDLHILRGRISFNRITYRYPDVPSDHPRCSMIFY